MWWKCNSFHWFLKPFNEKKKRENSEFEIFFCSEMDIDCIACNWQNHEIILKLLWPRLTAISWKMVALLVHFFLQWNKRKGTWCGNFRCNNLALFSLLHVRTYKSFVRLKYLMDYFPIRIFSNYPFDEITVSSNAWQ